MPKEPEHGGIIGRVPAIQDRIRVGIYVTVIGVGHRPARHGKLVVRSNPAKNPTIVDGHVEPRFAHRRQPPPKTRWSSRNADDSPAKAMTPLERPVSASR